MKKPSIIAIILIACMLFSLASVCALASGGEEYTDAMTEIEGNLSEFKIGETVAVADDGYIGIPLEVSVYYDTDKGDITSGHTGTPIIIYVVNSMVARVGKTKDKDIISGMLERGYAVVIFDYLNNIKAINPDLDWSAQLVRQSVQDGDFFDKTVFPEGSYPHTYVVPAGYDILMEQPYWSIDKHGAAGSLDAIVESWNTDLKGCKPNVVVPWTYKDGERKLTVNDKDGVAPEWYSDAAGKTVDNENGTYTKLRWTEAKDVTDCINPDGTPVDLNLYITLIYPSESDEKVPIMALSSSQDTLSAVTSKAERPQLLGAVFNGYAGVVFDHTYIPMERNFDYYDGNDAGGVTGDALSYQIEYNNDKEVKTAAMRYLRYLELDNPGVYNLNTDKIGVYGNSKGGWFSLLGEAIFQEPLISNPEDYDSVEELEIAITKAQSALYDKRIFEGHYGESRFEAALDGCNIEGECERYDTYTKDGITINAGTVQPWLTYDGVELISGAQLTYPSCGSSPEDVGEGHVPMFLVNNVYDGPYTTSNTFINAARYQNIVTLNFEVNIGHTLTYGPDADHGVDTYQAFFDFCGYHLKGDAVKVVWATPKEGAKGVSVTDGVTVKFLGSVSSDEIKKVTVTDGGGNTLLGEWSSKFGDTEWTFIPYDMKGNTDYTLTVPSDIKGDNGKEMGEVFERSFSTKPDSATAASTSVAVDGGSFAAFTVPELSAGTNRYFFRFRVENDAANTAELYAVDSFNSADPDSSTLGELLGKVSIKGSGLYEIDITDYIAAKVGESVTLFLKEGKSAGDSVILSDGFDTGISAVKKSRYSQHAHAVAPGGSEALSVFIVDNGNKWGYDYRFTNHTFYSNPSTAFTYANILGADAFTKEDYGRKFTVSFRVYDETSRLLQATLSHCTDEAYETVDYQYCIKNFRTVAGEWTDVTLEYTVYDMEYGYKGTSAAKTLTVSAFSDGINMSKMYFDDITVTESVTVLDVTDLSIAAADFGGADYKAPVSDKPITLYKGESAGESYGTLKDALTAYLVSDADTVRLNSNYTFTDSDISSSLSAVESLVIDLNGYTVNCENTEKSLLWIKSLADSGRTELLIKNGGINIGDTPLISFEDSDALEKKINIAFDNISFGILDGAFSRSYFTASDIADGASAEVNISVNLCTFDIPDEKLPYNSFTILNSGSGKLKVTYELNSPVFNLTSQKRVKVQKETMHTTFNKDGDKPYATLRLNAAEYPWDTAYAMTDSFGIFSGREEVDGYACYYLTESELATRYGMIPEEYSSAQDYPFIVFDKTGRVLLATHLLAGDGNTTALGYTAQRAVGEWYIFLRRDYEFLENDFNNFGFIMGDVTLDLNNKTVYGRSTKQIFDAVAKAGKYANIYVNNGTLVGETKPVLRFSSTTTGSYDGSETKTMSFYFDNVTFKASSAVDSLFVTGTPAVAVNGNLYFNGCTFDLTDAKESFTLFKLTEGTNKLSSEVIIKGGAFVSDTFDKLGLYTAMNENGSILFAKDDSGSYPAAITTGEGAYPPSDNIVTAEGNMIYTNGVTEGGITTYSLAENKYLTPYGTIPEQYSDPEKYPFLLFIDGAFHSAYTCWADSSQASSGAGSKDSPYGVLCEGAKDNIYRSSTRTVTILMRRDYEVQSGRYSNLCQIQGTVNIDLGGHTLTSGPNGLLTGTQKKAWDTTFNFKNGTIHATSAVPFSFGHHTGGDGYGFHFGFDGVTLGFAKGATATKYFETHTTDIGTGYLLKSSLTLRNCVIDLKTNAPSDKVTFITLKDDPDCHKTDVVFEGCTLKAGASFNFVLIDNSNKTGAKDTLVFKPYNGEYIKLSTDSGVSAPSGWFDTDIGSMKFYKKADDGETANYVLANLETEYGSIPEIYMDANVYPFVVFYYDKASNSTVCVGYTCWADSTAAGGGGSNPAGALVAAKDKAYVAGGATVLLRRDYDIATGSYNNLCHANGTITLDLGGHTLTGGTGSLFAANNKKNYNTTIVMKNGTFLLESNVLISLAASDGGNGYKFIITIEDVNIGFKNGATATKLIDTGYNENAAAATKSGADISFINCNIDLVTNAPDGNITLFNAAGDSDQHEAALTLKGGSIKVNPAKFTLAVIDNSSNTKTKDSLSFVRNVDGEYTEISVPSGATLNLGTQNGGKYSFVKKSDDGVNAIYGLVLTSAIDLDFAPKASITLDSDLYFNIYIPAHEALVGATLNGGELILGEAEDGYYKVRTSLPLEAATLVVTLDLGDDEVTGTFTFSLTKYVSKILAADLSDEEKTLVKDILAYVRSAYTYFIDEEDAKILADIDSVLDGYTTTLTKVEDTVASDTDNILSGATFKLEEKPSFRFYLPEGANVNDYTFKIGNSVLEYTAGTETAEGSYKNLTYVDISLYAYRMIENITIVKGSSTATYHINDYYDKTQAGGDSDTLDIITKFYIYCNSAAAYRTVASK